MAVPMRNQFIVKFILDAWKKLGGYAERRKGHDGPYFKLLHADYSTFYACVTIDMDPSGALRRLTNVRITSLEEWDHIYGAVADAFDRYFPPDRGATAAPQQNRIECVPLRVFDWETRVGRYLQLTLDYWTAAARGKLKSKSHNPSQIALQSLASTLPTERPFKEQSTSQSFTPPLSRHNPWLRLPDEPPFVLTEDATLVARHNERYRSTAYEIHLTALPEPFTGNTSAPVVLLSLNPGHTEGDAAEHSDPVYTSVIRGCHAELPTTHPFYPLDPAHQSKLAGRWWLSKMREIVDAVGVDAATRGLLAVQFFPYHSSKYRPLLAGVLPSQAWNVMLVQEAMARSALIIVMRNRTEWFKAVPMLETYSSLFELRHKRNPAVSRGNLPTGVFERVCSAIAS